MAKDIFDVVYIDDDLMMADIFNQFVGWKYRQWHACSFTDSAALYNQITAGEVAANVWIIDLMMPNRNGTEIAAAVRRTHGPDTIILGYTALDPYTLQSDPAYKDGLKDFTKIVRKQGGIAQLMALTEDVLGK